MGEEGWGRSGLQVRNTFIDLCPADERDSDDDAYSGTRSPHRRSGSAPPSPNKRHNDHWREEYYSDAEQADDDPDAIPHYDTASHGNAWSKFQQQGGGGKDLPWIPPGSPKKVGQVGPMGVPKKSKQDRGEQGAGLGSFLRNSGDPFGPEDDYDFGGGPHGHDPRGGYPPDPRGMGVNHLGDFGRRGINQFSLGAGLGGARSHEEGAFGGRGIGQVPQYYPQGGHQWDGGRDAGAYVTDKRPSNLGSSMNAEAPVYIVSPGAEQYPEPRGRHGGGGYMGPGDAAQRHGDASQRGRAPPPGAGWPTYYGNDSGPPPPKGYPKDPRARGGHMPMDNIYGDGLYPAEGHYMDGSMRGMMPPQMPMQGDAGDRRPDSFLDPMRPQYGQPGMPMADPYGRGPLDPYRPDAYGRGGPPRGMPWQEQALPYGVQQMGDAGDRMAAAGFGMPGDRNGRGKGAAPGGKGGARTGRERERGSDKPNNGAGCKGGDKGTPWVMQGRMERGAGGKTPGEPKPEKTGTKVPLSGGGPKRTDYIKKYGADGEALADGEKDSSQLPITTMMLKNIPCRKSQEEVMAHIDGKGFGNRYDFFYLPRDVKFSANLGYAFINFITPEDAQNFMDELHDYRFPGSGSSKACVVVPAHVQGLMNNLSAFKRTEVMRSSRKPYFSGVVTL